MNNSILVSENIRILLKNVHLFQQNTCHSFVRNGTLYMNIFEKRESLVKIAISSDHGGNNLRREIMGLLDELHISYEDFGPQTNDSVDYPDYARPVAEGVASGQFDRGILICGTGIGISIAANKFKGIRCALVHDTFSAKATRCHNDSTVLAMGERVIGPGLAREIVVTWLNTDFEGGRHTRRVEKIAELEG